MVHKASAITMDHFGSNINHQAKLNIVKMNKLRTLICGKKYLVYETELLDSGFVKLRNA